MKKHFLIVIVIYAAYLGLKNYNHPSFGSDSGTGTKSVYRHTSSETFDTKDSGHQIQGEGIVSKVLSDDNDGSRHQKFIIKIGSGQTLLIAHNIDIASRVSGIQVGDKVGFSGIYEWNSKGGIVHWTHRDPSGRHAAGWLKHGNNTYQ